MSEHPTREAVKDAVVRYQEICQSCHEPPDLRAFLSQCGPLPLGCLLVLLRLDQRWRWQHGRASPVEDYLSLLPPGEAEGEAALELVYCDYLLRQEEGQRLTTEEYVARFPGLADRLRLLLQLEEALDEVASEDAPEPPDRSSTAAGTETPAAPPTHPTRIGNYQVIEELGRGGVGVVYRAVQVGLNREVALKMLLAGPFADPAQLKRFRREAEAVARLQHSNIVQIYEIDEWQGRPFFSMELATGGPLDRKIAGVPYLPHPAAALVEALARAVQAAHEAGIVHRDLKPGNVLLTTDGTPKITDFGLAKKVGTEGVLGSTISGAVVGTPAYMAPEQATGHTEQIGPATDVYGLGAILYELLTGLPPFHAPSVLEVLDRVRSREPAPPSKLQPSVPRDLETICLRCLRKEPSKRYASAALLAEDLAAFRAGRAIDSTRDRLLVRVADWACRSPGEAVLLGVAVAAGLGLAAGLLWSNLLAAAALGPVAVFAATWLSNARLKAALREAARLRAAAERSAGYLHALLGMTRQLMSTPDLAVLLRVVSETTTQLTDAERATIYVVDRERGELESLVALGEGVGKIRAPLGVGIAGAVAQTGRPVNIADAYTDPRFNPEVDRRTGYRTRSLLTLPMFAQDGTVLGVFQVLNKRTGAFDVEDVETLTTLAASAGAAVENTLQRLPGGVWAKPAPTIRLPAESQLRLPGDR